MQTQFSLEGLKQSAATFDFAKVPCARDCILNGIGGGVGLGLVSFVKTSEEVCSD